MTPKEKAKELVNKFKFTKFSVISSNPVNAALVCVDEIMKPIDYFKFGNFVTRHLNPTEEKYWNEVKQEINKL